MKIPPNFKDLLPLPLETLRQLAQVVGQPQLLNKLKEAAELVGVKDSAALDSIQQVFQQAGKWADFVTSPTGWSKAELSGCDGVNATGEIFTSRWTNGVIPQQSALRAAQLLSNTTLSHSIGKELQTLVLGLTGASEMLLAVNTSAALHALAASAPQNRAWILPRIDCTRPFRFGATTSGSIRTPLDLAGKKIIEVGSNQECTREDFLQCGSAEQPAILSVSPPHLHGAAAEDHLNNLRECRDSSQGTWVELLYNGSLHSIESFPDIALTVADRWHVAADGNGPDILLVPCDLWLGGPEACLILTRSKTEWWNNLERLLQGSGLEASAWTQVLLLDVLKANESEESWQDTPIGATLSTSLENQKYRAQKIASQIEDSAEVESVSVQEKECRIGMGMWTDLKLPSFVLQIKPQQLTPSELAAKLSSPSTNSGSTLVKAKPVWCNVLSEHVEIVIRTIRPEDDASVVAHFSHPQNTSSNETDSPAT